MLEQLLRIGCRTRRREFERIVDLSRHANSNVFCHLWGQRPRQPLDLIGREPRFEFVPATIVRAVIFVRADMLSPSISQTLHESRSSALSHSRYRAVSCVADGKNILIYNATGRHAVGCHALAQTLRCPTLGQRLMNRVAIVLAYEQNR